jgi:hypothetical protein
MSLVRTTQGKELSKRHPLCENCNRFERAAQQCDSKPIREEPVGQRLRILKGSKEGHVLGGTAGAVSMHKKGNVPSLISQKERRL